MRLLLWFPQVLRSRFAGARRLAGWCLIGWGLVALPAQADRMGAIEPRLKGLAAPPPASWQTRRDYSRLAVSRALVLPALAQSKAAKLEGAKPGVPFQIGLARELPADYRGDLAETAKWIELAGGGRVASFSVRSPDAQALRLAMRARLPQGARVRFFEIDNPDRRYPVFKPSDFLAKDGQSEAGDTDGSLGMRWSPMVTGDGIGVEIELPPSADPADVSFTILRASHIWRDSDAQSPANSANRLQSKVDPTCSTVDVACKTLPDCPKSAVARLLYTGADGVTYTCTGTAVNSGRSRMENLDSPFLLTAHHCISTAAVAASVVSDWHYEHQTCGGTVVNPQSQRLQGGAELIAGDADTDSALLRLRDALPNSVCLAAWDAQSGWANGTQVTAIHHPGGEFKEWAGGSIERTALSLLDDTDLVGTILVQWSEGQTQPGSSGSGLFTSTSDGDALIGVLSGGPADDCSRDGYGRLDQFYATEVGTQLMPTSPPPPDDHGNNAAQSTGVLLGSETAGQIDNGSDADVFRILIAERGTLTVFTTGPVDTFGRLKRADESTIAYNDDGGAGSNFKIAAEVDPGTYYIKVNGYGIADTGSYRLHVEFVAASASKKVLVPLFISAAALERDGRQGFVRVFNRSSRSGEVQITAVDDSGKGGNTVKLSIGASETRGINSADLEQGNESKGLSGGTGSGSGDWRLEFDSELDIEVAAYLRTRDGFLTSMHDLTTVEARTGAHHVPVFNPASNTRQRSLLRLINPDPNKAVRVTIAGQDDAGRRGASTVRLRLLAGATRTLDARQLEEGADDLTGRLGDGEGKWRLFVEAEGRIQVVDLLESVNGNLTNLSTPGGNNYSQ